MNVEMIQWLDIRVSSYLPIYWVNINNNYSESASTQIKSTSITIFKATPSVKAGRSFAASKWGSILHFSRNKFSIAYF